MYISFMHPSGKLFQLPVEQVVVYADDGQPCAIAYAHAGLIVHTNSGQADFGKHVSQLKIKPLDVKSSEAKAHV